MNNPICNTQFDTRDLEEYREEQEVILIDSLNDHLRKDNKDHVDFETFEEIILVDELEDFYKEIEEYEALKDFCKELEDYAPDYKYGSTVIHDSYFETAMDELLEDYGDIPNDLPSYLTIQVDYSALEIDYTTITYDCEDYLIR